MSKNVRATLYALRKKTGVPLTRPYKQYSVEILQQELNEIGVEQVVESFPPLQLPESEPDADSAREVLTEPPQEYGQTVPVQAQADPEEMPGQRLNTKPEDEPIRIDEQGRLWYQEEVRKPAYPKPRGRRVLKYLETGVQKQTVQNGEYIETFEVAGQGEGRPAEVKITLPSYQVGIYRDRRFPFRIHCYGEREGFDFFEVNDYYGGAELVPDIIKRVYIENELCYEIRSVIRAIENEYRQLMLMGKV